MPIAPAARLLLGLVLVAMGAGACTEKTPSTPTPETTVNGTWTGTLPVRDVTANMTWMLTQANGAVAGPVLILLPNGIVLLNGTLSGTLSGSVLTYTIAVSSGAIPSQPGCTGQMAGTMNVAIAATSTMTGPMAVTSSNCSPPFAGGTITLTKQ